MTIHGGLMVVAGLAFGIAVVRGARPIGPPCRTPKSNRGQVQKIPVPILRSGLGVLPPGGEWCLSAKEG